MNTHNRHLTRRIKAFIEQTAGVTITRAPAHPPNKHADAELRRIRTWSSQDVVFDVGANDGRTILRIQEQLNSPRIFAFEPVASTYETLVRRTRHLDNVRCFRQALGAEPGRETIFLSEIDAMNSFSAAWAEPIGTEEVEVSTVDAVMEAHGIDFIHFLKIDVEGHDLEVLKGAQHALSSARVALVQVEVGVDQMEKQQPSLETIRRHLAPMGYYLYGIYNQCRRRAHAPDGWTGGEADGYHPAVLAYADALFLNARL